MASHSQKVAIWIRGHEKPRLMGVASHLLSLRCGVIANDFSLENSQVFSCAKKGPRCATAIGPYAVDLAALSVSCQMWWSPAVTWVLRSTHPASKILAIQGCLKVPEIM